MVISLSPIDENTLSRLRRSIERTCKVAKPHTVTGATIDIPALSDEANRHLDNGEPPNEWVEWWTTKATYIEGLKGSALITLEPGIMGSRRVQPIDLQLLKDLMETVIWTRAGGVILAWGVPDSAMHQKHLRKIDCSGALGVQVDGCGAILVCDLDTAEKWTW